MADYIYLLENRLNLAQRAALTTVRELARQKSLTIFLVGGAVRDLTSGSPVRDLDVVVQGNARQLRKDLEKAGAILSGEQESLQTLHLRFPGGVRMEFGSTLSVTYPKPGKAVSKLSGIQDDLRRRDFTVNAMALSLNEGSYGLLMDPLNGVADIENRQLRLVSNYGFIEDPVRMIRAARLMARLGWTMDERTETRYQTGKQENYINVLSDYNRGYELEEIVHEEDPQRVMRRLESEGWMKVLAPYWGPAKVNAAELDRLRDVQTQLQVQGIYPDTAAAAFPLLTAKLAAKEAATLKSSFPRTGFVQEIDSLDADSKAFAAQLGGKAAALPSDSWKLITAARPEIVLWTAFSNKNAALQAKFKAFSDEWPQARTRMPYVLMQEMRITPDLPGYEALLEELFFQLMDGKLATPEEMKAYLEPHSPPAPPPPVNLRRARAAKKEARPAKARKSKVKADAANGEADEAPENAPAETPQDAPVTEVAAPAAKARKSGASPKVAPVIDAKPAKAVAAPVKSAAPAKKAAALPEQKKPQQQKPEKNKPEQKKPEQKTANQKKAEPLKGAKGAAPQKSSAKGASVKVSGQTPAAKKSVAPAPAAKKPTVKTSAPVKKAPPLKAVAKKAAAKNVPAKKAVAPAKKAIKAAVKGPARKR